MPRQQKHKNHLALIRKKNTFSQKQISTLLGHQTSDQISRYERGAKLPGLKSALKLSLIYRIPIQVLFYGYYESCFKEFQNRQKALKITANSSDLLSGDGNHETEFCTFAEKLKIFTVAEPELDKVRHHITELIKARGKKMKHFPEE
jgi:transcriptional regulator with XRE-family HTH domain